MQMKRLSFSANGKIESIDGKLLEYSENEDPINADENLKKSGDLDFLKNDSPIINNVSDSKYWSLYQGKNFLKPIKFSNGKTQEDIVKETLEHIRGGKKIVLIHGACGTGKSAIALNIAREMGKAAIVVPVKGLQKQYEDDYTNDKYLLKKSGNKMKIAVILNSA